MAITLKVTTKVQIEKPIHEVFQHFADPEFNGNVDLDTVSTRIVSGRPNRGIVS